MPASVLFISCVTDEFRDYRKALRHELTRPQVAVSVQEDFVATGTETLDKLDDYLRSCDGVIHLVGEMPGALAQAPSVAVLRTRYPDFAERFPDLGPFLERNGPALSYTQWEAWLALYHGKRLLICAPSSVQQRDSSAEPNDQQAHLQRLARVERYIEFNFRDATDLALKVLRSPLGNIVGDAAAAPRHLPGSPNRFFTGRDQFMPKIKEALGPLPRQSGEPLRLGVLCGMGGVGKTQLALEYAWKRTSHHSAMLFADASERGSLERVLSGFTAPAVLNLPEEELTEQSRKLAAVIRWLNNHPGWLLLADNVDSEAAAQALDDALVHLTGGQVLVTSRLARERWGGHWRVLEVQELTPEDAATFVLNRTHDSRRKAPDDETQAAQLAQVLGCLPLALEQAAAYVAQRRLTLAAYLVQWTHSRDHLLGWFDARVMGYPCSVAATWQTSVQQLSAPALRLLQRLAWLAPDPVPESLLDVRVGNADLLSADPWGTLAELAALSLARQDEAPPQFSVHRLVQEVTRSRLYKVDKGLADKVFSESLRWIGNAFVGEPSNVENWLVLKPLLPHGLQLTAADSDSFTDVDGSSTRLMNDLAGLMMSQANFNAAELLYKKALAVNQNKFGRSPKTAVQLTNLSNLYIFKNQLPKAIKFAQEAINIDEYFYGEMHPTVATDRINLAHALMAIDRLDGIDRLEEAEKEARQALRIDEQSMSSDKIKFIARDKGTLGRILHLQGDATNAKVMLASAINLNKKIYGIKNPKYIVDTINRGLIHLEEKEFDLAESIFKEALSVHQKHYGNKHPKIAIDLNNLALVYLNTKRLPEAESRAREAINIDEEVYGLDHPQVGVDLSTLAGVLCRSDHRLPDAESLLRRSFRLLARGWGANHKTTQKIRSQHKNTATKLGLSNHEIEKILNAEISGSPAS